MDTTPVPQAHVPVSQDNDPAPVGVARSCAVDGSEDDVVEIPPQPIKHWPGPEVLCAYLAGNDVCQGPHTHKAEFIKRANQRFMLAADDLVREKKWTPGVNAYPTLADAKRRITERK